MFNKGYNKIISLIIAICLLNRVVYSFSIPEHSLRLPAGQKNTNGRINLVMNELETETDIALSRSYLIGGDRKIGNTGTIGRFLSYAMPMVVLIMGMATQKVTSAPLLTRTNLPYSFVAPQVISDPALEYALENIKPSDLKDIQLFRILRRYIEDVRNSKQPYIMDNSYQLWAQAVQIYGVDKGESIKTRADFRTIANKMYQIDHVFFDAIKKVMPFSRQEEGFKEFFERYLKLLDELLSRAKARILQEGAKIQEIKKVEQRTILMSL